MATVAQRAELARIARNDRSALRVAWSTLFGGLVLSTAAKAESSIIARNGAIDPLALAISVLPPLSLFAVSMLIERIDTDPTIRRLLATSYVVGLLFSWVHIAEVVYHFSTPGHSKSIIPNVVFAGIALLFPLIIDIPMLLSGKTIMAIRNRQNAPTNTTTPKAKTTTNRRKANSTTKSTQTNTTNGNQPKLTEPTKIVLNTLTTAK